MARKKRVREVQKSVQEDVRESVQEHLLCSAFDGTVTREPMACHAATGAREPIADHAATGTLCDPSVPTCTPPDRPAALRAGPVSPPGLCATCQSPYRLGTP